MMLSRCTKCIASSGLLRSHLKYTNRGLHVSLNVRNSSGYDYENPFSRTFRILRDDITGKNRPEKTGWMGDDGDIPKHQIPRHPDIVIIGGGAIGSSIAYWLKEKSSREGFRVVVVEKDTTYSKCSTTLSVGGLRQQFSLPENIEMSMYGAEFLRTLKRRFGPEADVCFVPNGYLTLASEEGAQQLLDNSRLQREMGAVNQVYTKDQLKAKFPWLNVADVELGCLGLEKEGWFDPWSLLTLLRCAAQNMGVQYVQGEVVDFRFEERRDIQIEGIDHFNYEGIQDIVIKLPNGEHQVMNFAYCIIAAGCESGTLAKQARIGNGEGILSLPLPVERRKRYVFRYECQGEPPGINTPLTVDHSGVYFRREGLGGAFIAGLSPALDEEPTVDNLDVDFKYFDERVWPLLAHRIPAFEAIKVKNGWAGYYDYNYYDENGIIGPHPYYNNLYVATGFSGHGIQQAPAVGRAVSELILDGEFQTIDLTRLGFDRLVVDKPMNEICII